MQQIVVAVSGASGAIYAVRLIRFLLQNQFHVHFIASDYGKFMLAHELGWNMQKESIETYLQREEPDLKLDGKYEVHDNNNLTSSLASGNPNIMGMVVVPSTMKTLSTIANGHSANLIERAADCVLKERQTFVIVPRETPLNLIQIRNMETITLAGGLVLPAMPAFYQNPKSFADLGDFMASRILNLFRIPNQLYPKWRQD
jgi:4-hydroxy-3-polyprenylbenzoate decarboxylase